MSCKVTHCTGCISAITRPHQLQPHHLHAEPGTYLKHVLHSGWFAKHLSLFMQMWFVDSSCILTHTHACTLRFTTLLDFFYNRGASFALVIGSSHAGDTGLWWGTLSTLWCALSNNSSTFQPLLCATTLNLKKIRSIIHVFVYSMINIYTYLYLHGL